MNIFVTDSDPIISARNLDNKRIIHCPKECIEMLGIYVHSVTDKWVIPFPLWGNEDRNEPMFLYNHPCSRWIKEDKANLNWLYQHTIALFAEHQYRFDKVNIVQHFLEEIKPFVPIIDNKPKRFQNSSLYKNLPVIEAYRQTMLNKWLVTDKIKPEWTKRDKPTWFSKQLEI